jgi:hypothetical protein
MNIIIVLLLIFLAVWAFRKFKLSPTSTSLAVNAKPLLTDNELEFYQRLIPALPQYRVMVQVSFSALLQADKALSKTEAYSLRGRYKQKYADFVIVEPESLKVVAIIELDDRTHSPERDKERDALLETAGYRVLRFQSKQKPSIDEISALFFVQKSLDSEQQF